MQFTVDGEPIEIIAALNVDENCWTSVLVAFKQGSDRKVEWVQGASCELVIDAGSVQFSGPAFAIRRDDFRSSASIKFTVFGESVTLNKANPGLASLELGSIRLPTTKPNSLRLFMDSDAGVMVLHESGPETRKSPIRFLPLDTLPELLPRLLPDNEARSVMAEARLVASKAPQG